MSAQPSPSSSGRAAPTAWSTLADDYQLRMMLCLVAALLVAVMCVRAPAAGGLIPVGWGSDATADALISIDDLRRSDALLTASAAPMAAISTRQPDAAADDGDGAPSTNSSTTDDTEGERPERTERPATPLQRATVLNPDELPQVRGGIGRFYMSIAYPEAARRAGVQGKLVLDFYVEPDGQVSNIILAKSLHPLCDSSAISSLKATRFTPAQHKGAAVRTRARLPVTFRLLPTNPAPDSSLAALR